MADRGANATALRLVHQGGVPGCRGRMDMDEIAYFDMHCHLGFCEDAVQAARALAALGVGVFSNTVTPAEFAKQRVALAGAGKEVFLFRFCHDVHPFCLSDVLLRLTVHGLLLAESAILFQFDTVGVVFLVLHGVVVSLLAFVASERDLHSHCRHLLNFCLPA